jgi:hypothetical protein
MWANGRPNRVMTQDAISNLASNTEDLAGRATNVVSEVIRDWDSLLLGAATLAIAAAVGMSDQRRAT